MCLTSVTAGGLATMTYTSNGGDPQDVTGAAMTVVSYQDGQPAAGYLQINCETVNLCFGIDPFTGTGSYSGLDYFVFSESWVLGPDCHGFWTISDGDPPVLDVVTFTVAGESTTWAMTLTANLVWFVEDCTQPPLSLNVSSLTMTTQPESTSDAVARADFDEVVRQKTTELARRIGVKSFPA